MPAPSKRQILDVCNSLFQSNSEKYYHKAKKGFQFNATAMANDFIFQLCIEPDLFEAVLDSVHIWWKESSFNPESKPFKA